MKKKILMIVAFIVAIFGVFTSIYLYDSDINNTVSELQDEIIQEIQNVDNLSTTEDVIVSEETEDIVENTIEAVEAGEDLSTTEIIESSEEEENNLEDELENDAIVEQENIAYEGTVTGNGLSLLGAYQGLTYYSQADSRWANIMYSSINDSSQTMKSSACGPTSGAMVVSSSKGTILPTAMAQLAVDNRI